MQVIIVGCGKVGRNLAEQLQAEDIDITLVDVIADKINDLCENIDAMGIVGNGASINTLMEAGVDTADILIAVTASDELNLLCCLIAQTRISLRKASEIWETLIPSSLNSGRTLNLRSSTRPRAKVSILIADGKRRSREISWAAANSGLMIMVTPRRSLMNPISFS